MTGQATWSRLPDGKRIHFQHGPIDIITEAFGDSIECERAYQQGFECFQSILAELVTELALLRQNVGDIKTEPKGSVARTMVETVSSFAPEFITPMAAVAGAVADQVLSATVHGRELRKAYVNNGGDIAFHLSPGEVFSTTIVDDQDNPACDAKTQVSYDDPVRGIATSGWRGRSQSLGIADAVTVLAKTARQADAAATMIANSVTVKHSSIKTEDASTLRDDTDLGNLQVTTDVGHLPGRAIDESLNKGQITACEYMDRGLLQSAYLSVQGQRQTVVTENMQQIIRRQG